MTPPKGDVRPLLKEALRLMGDKSVDLDDFGLHANALRAVADWLYEPGDNRLPGIKWDYQTAMQYGKIRSHLRSLADHLESE